MDHHLYEGGAYHPQQQPVFLLDDDHDHWPVHHAAAAAAPATVPHAKPLPPPSGAGRAYPAAPIVDQGEEEDDEATESESERGGGSRATARLHHLPSAGHRPNSALTGASRQPSPTPSVSLHGGLPPAVQAGAAPTGVQQATAPPPASRGGSKGGGKARKPGGKGGITLRLLIEAGILQPGHNVLSVVRLPRLLIYTFHPAAVVRCMQGANVPVSAGVVSSSQFCRRQTHHYSLVLSKCAAGLQGHEAAGDPAARRPHLQQHQRVNHDL